MKPKLWTAKYTISLVAIFFVYIGAGLLLSALTIFAKNLTGLDIYAGMMTSTFTLAALAVRVITGKAVERIKCKSAVLAGLSLSVAGSVLFINCQSIFVALAARAVQGIGFGIASTGLSTYIAKTLNPERLLEGISYGAVVTSIAMVIGPSIAFKIIGSEYDNFNLLFIISIVVGISTLFLIFVIREDRPAQQYLGSNDKSGGKIPWSLLLLPTFIMFLNSLTQSSITSFAAISMDFPSAGVFFSINAGGMIVSRFIMNKLVKKYGKFQMILINSIIYSACVFMLTQIKTLPQMLVIAFPAGFAMGSIAPIINTYLVEQVPENKKGIASAIYFSFLDIGYAIGSVFWGFIASNMGYSNVFLLASFVQAICVILAVIQLRVHNARGKINNISIEHMGINGDDRVYEDI
jgi:MFS family permease